MIPTVSQQLSAIRHTIAKTIIPAINPDDSFAQEQAGLVLASLDWALDVAGSEYRYELVEHGEYREVLDELLALNPSGEVGTRGREVLDRPATATADLEALREQNIVLKGLVENAFVALTTSPDGPGGTRCPPHRVQARATPDRAGAGLGTDDGLPGRCRGNRCGAHRSGRRTPSVWLTIVNMTAR